MTQLVSHPAIPAPAARGDHALWRRRPRRLPDGSAALSRETAPRLPFRHHHRHLLGRHQRRLPRRAPRLARRRRGRAVQALVAASPSSRSSAPTRRHSAATSCAGGRSCSPAARARRRGRARCSTRQPLRELLSRCMATVNGEIVGVADNVERGRLQRAGAVDDPLRHRADRHLGAGGRDPDLGTAAPAQRARRASTSTTSWPRRRCRCCSRRCASAAPGTATAASASRRRWRRRSTWAPTASSPCRTATPAGSARPTSRWCSATRRRPRSSAPCSTQSSSTSSTRTRSTCSASTRWSSGSPPSSAASCGRCGCWCSPPRKTSASSPPSTRRSSPGPCASSPAASVRARPRAPTSCR